MPQFVHLCNRDSSANFVVFLQRTNEVILTKHLDHAWLIISIIYVTNVSFVFFLMHVDAPADMYIQAALHTLRTHAGCSGDLYFFSSRAHVWGLTVWQLGR